MSEVAGRCLRAKVSVVLTSLWKLEVANAETWNLLVSTRT